MKTKYKTVAQNISSQVKIERSVFIGHTASVAKEEEAKEFIAQVRAEHSQATHNCYAYRLGLSQHPTEYYSDHGEPSGTAGRPILNAILQADLTNTVVVVTRYFGGKKLGVRGLIDAYHSTAAQALAAAGSKVIIPCFHLFVSCDYSQLPHVEYILQKFTGEKETTEYGVKVGLQVLIPEKFYSEAISALSALPGVSLDHPRE